MKEFCKFNDIYERINVLEESVSKNFPGLKEPWGKAAKEARNIGASAPTREAKSIILNIIVGLMSKRVGRELTTQEERDLLRFRNIPSQNPLVEFLKTQEIDGHTYASVINDASPADIEEAAAGTGIADPVEFQVGQRSAQRKEAYKRRAEDREEAKAEAEAMADAAEEGGDEELANSLDEVGDYIVKFAKSITEVEGAPLDFDDLDVDLSLVSNKDEIAERLKGIMADAGYTVEITPAGINAEAPVGTFGDQDKAEDLVKGLVMNLYPDVREDQVAVFLNTDTAVEDQETPELRGSAVADGVEAEVQKRFRIINDSPDSHDEDYMAAAKAVHAKYKRRGDEARAAAAAGLISRAEATMAANVEDGEAYQSPYEGPSDTEVMEMAGREGIGEESFIIDQEGGLVNRDEILAMIKSAKASYEQAEETVTESYTSQYVVGLPQKSKEKVEPITESVGFKERFIPKTSEQLAELRNYGL